MTYQANLFKGKQALVTGGTRGIGAAVANQLASLGASVVATARSVSSHELTHDISVKTMDVTSSNDVEQVIASLERLDIVVNCAGAIQRGEEHKVDVFEQILAVNLTGSMRVCSAARPLLASSQGTIVNIASMLTFFGGALVPGYAASKGGVAQLTKSLALAYAADSIRVNAVAPGWIATQLTQGVQDDPERYRAILDRTPLQRWGTPEDIAKAVMFLCSDAAAFMTGAIVPVDGGYLTA